MRRLARLSLAQQVMLIVALGLVLAQSVNFALQLRERRGFGIENAAGPAIARLADAIDAGRAGQWAQRGGPRRGRVIATASNPIAPDASRLTNLETFLRARLDEASARSVADVQAALQPGPRGREILIVAVRVDDGT